MLKKMIAMLLVICIAGIGMPAQAGMIATPTERDTLLRLLDRSDVQTQLQAYGVSAEQAKARVAALSDEEVAQVAAQIDSLPAGGDVGGALVTAVLVVFLVLLLTDILGFTKIFPFTKPIR